MDFDLVLPGAFFACLLLFTAAFHFQRLRGRRKKSANPDYRGFYPSTAALGLIMLTLQTMAQPDLHHAIELRQTEDSEDDEEGDPDDPAARLNRQLKGIRNGELIDRLKVPLRR